MEIDRNIPLNLIIPSGKPFDYETRCNKRNCAHYLGIFVASSSPIDHVNMSSGEKNAFVKVTGCGYGAERNIERDGSVGYCQSFEERRRKLI